MNWDKINITKQDGEEVEAQAPIIISASRSTDIPAFLFFAHVTLSMLTIVQ